MAINSPSQRHEATKVIKGKNKKDKVIPLHAMEVHGVRGGTASTHS
jgi:hypothetical protein